MISADTDIAYTKKDVWASFERYAQEVSADMVFMRESLVNTGHFYARPNERIIALMEQWMASEGEWFQYNDQGAFNRLKNHAYIICTTKLQRDQAKQRKMRLISKSIVSKY